MSFDPSQGNPDNFTIRPGDQISRISRKGGSNINQENTDLLRRVNDLRTAQKTSSQKGPRRRRSPTPSRKSRASSGSGARRRSSQSQSRSRSRATSQSRSRRFSS
ncbi:hypothetical protein ASPWEDRAFT_549805 [Aspergillus wentii DTO 134E9]|uniref:Uncharacterized protein n=1 Tax=Aspergillus wentii DTO 134E9 TaxID=1073089 RepID=A0A1L9RGF8_ASPWE|nr:uncharacterized protein ASPWEDRAFT_549805 [Aspergillus wentii DTO 134E9]KAI9927721.1 hypothetical protein MW887_002573 [Aspergillus wentii]OJJ33933.1 hypothetical protein ASPWEDRAFT_549805 [Aspergillus wentii DTO 134E9]